MPSNIDIAELKRLHAAATPGEWEAARYSNYAGWSIYAPSGAGCIAERWYATGQQDEIPRNDLWIAAAHNAFPALIARLEAMQWLDISDAPKDGTEVLGIHVTYWDHSPPTIYGPFTMRWAGGCWQSCWEGSQVIEYVSDLSGITYRQIELPPTHYMPLPAPPEATR